MTEDLKSVLDPEFLIIAIVCPLLTGHLILVSGKLSSKAMTVLGRL